VCGNTCGWYSCFGIEISQHAEVLALSKIKDKYGRDRGEIRFQILESSRWLKVKIWSDGHGQSRHREVRWGREYGPFHFEPAQEAPSEGGGEENDEDNYEEDDDADKDVDVFVVKSEAVSVPVLPEATQVALINKLREGPRSTQDAGGSIPGADENVDQILS
jgi:hypothetical protein